MCYVCLYGSKAFNIASTSSSDNHFSTILNDFWQYNNPTNRITDSPSQRTPASLNHYSAKNTTHQWSSLLEKNADISQFINPETHALESDSTDKFDNVIPYHRRHAKHNSLPTGLAAIEPKSPQNNPASTPQQLATHGKPPIPSLLTQTFQEQQNPHLTQIVAPQRREALSSSAEATFTTTARHTQPMMPSI